MCGFGLGTIGNTGRFHCEIMGPDKFLQDFIDVPETFHVNDRTIPDERA